MKATRQPDIYDVHNDHWIYVCSILKFHIGLCWRRAYTSYNLSIFVQIINLKIGAIGIDDFSDGQMARSGKALDLANDFLKRDQKILVQPQLQPQLY